MNCLCTEIACIQLPFSFFMCDSWVNVVTSWNVVSFSPQIGGEWQLTVYQPGYHLCTYVECSSGASSISCSGYKWEFVLRKFQALICNYV